MIAALLATPHTAQAASVEITPSATAVTASTHDGNLPANTVDNDHTTRWSGKGDGAWLQLDLGTTKTVSHVKLAVHQGTTRQNIFEIQYWNGSTWVTTHNGRTSGTTTSLETFTFTPVQTTKIRYLGHGYTAPTGTGDWNSLTEVEIWSGDGDGSTPTPGTPVKVPVGGTAVTASTHDGNVPANAVDNDHTTRWSGKGDGAWLQLDLGTATTVSHVKLAVHQGTTRQNVFEIQYWNGSTWVTAHNGRTSGTTTSLETFSFTPVQTTKIRYLGHGYTASTGTGDWNSLTEVEIWTGDPGNGGGGEVPADVLDLGNWKLQLPIGASESPTEIKQPQLDSYSHDPYFMVTGDAVQFRAPVNGVTTSGSNYPRSELREMTNGGTTNAAWSSTSGTHTLTVREAFTHLPEGKPELVGAQIHGVEDDVTALRLEGSRLWITDGDNSNHHLITGDYELGTVFEVKYVVGNGEIDIYYNGQLETTLDHSDPTNYFKAGAYTQANCTNSSPCSTSNYGEVEIHQVSVTHGGDQGPGPGPGPVRTVNVATSAQLQTAFGAAQAGDRIVLADGQYTIGKMSGKNGTATQPITVVAANRGRAVINNGQLEVANSSYVTFEGLKWTNSNTLKITSSNNVRLTRNHFRLTEESSLKWVLIGGANSHHNRVDHNLFEEKHQLGNFITIDGSETQQSQYDLIDHNHFRNIGPRAQNEMEAIRVGWSEISRSSGHTVIESNLFENCDGDPEIISVKSNDNIVRHNTFRASQGTLSQRHGNRGTFHGNFFFGEGKSGTGGIRVYGQDHKIYNNYFEGLTGTGYDAALQLDGGDVDTSGALSAHWRVYRATVVNNTFVNNVSNIEIGANYSLAPVDSVIADNVVTGSQGKLFNELKKPVNMTYSGNIAWPTGSAAVGVTQPASAIRPVDPLLVRDGSVYRIGAGSPAIDAGVSRSFVTDDMDGQARTGAPDVGADERSSAAAVRGPLTATDVGPGAP
ncbi:chondroitinase-B domain-containing protein [Streptomyces capparidis]